MLKSKGTDILQICEGVFSFRLRIFIFRLRVFIDLHLESCLLFDALVTHLFCFLEILASQDKVRTEIFFTHHWIDSQLFGGTLEKNVSIKQQVSAVGQTECFQCIMVSYKDTDILSFNFHTIC